MQEALEVEYAMNNFGSGKMDHSEHIIFSIAVPNKPAYHVWLTDQPKKCSKCDGKGHLGWNATRNYPVVCKCVIKVFSEVVELVA